MKYVSTRGHGNPVTFEDTLFLSCPDGGLFVPQSVPKIDPDTLREWSKLTFVDMAKRITRRFISEEEISTDVLDGCLDRAFGSFSHPEVTPVTRLPGGLNVMELHHGKTLAFKDLAMSCVGQFFRHFLTKRRKRVVIVVVTSGDTGSAAIEGVRGNEWVDIVVFLPENGCSRAQVLQMVTVTDDNVHVFKIRAPLSRVDDARDIIACDEAFCEEHGFTSINSTNWSRIMIQTIHYFYGYFQVCGEVGEEVEVAVPTGAAGNIAGGLFAREMGLPVRFVSGVNINNIFARGLSTGGYSRRDVTATIASAMDIENPYNIERVLYVLSGGDHTLINRLFEEFGKTGACSFPEALLKKVSSGLKTHTAHDQRIEEVMRRCWSENNYAICPHTAVGVSYFYQQQDSTKPGTEVKPTILCVSTASPAKFSEVLEAAGVPPQTSSKLAGLDEKPVRFSTVEADENYEQFLRRCVSEITQRRRVEDSGQSSR